MTHSNTTDSADFSSYEINNISVGIIIYITCMALALAFAVCSNCLVIYCVVRLEKLRTITNIFICNLAISDILLAAYVMPLKLHDISHSDKSWYEGVIHCKVVNCCPILVISSSIYTLVSVSFERRQVMQGQGHEKLITRQKQIAIICITWVFSAGIATPTLLEYAVYEKKVRVGNHTRTLTSCGSNISRELALANAIFVFIVSYLIPVILMTRNYSQVAIYVWRKGKWIKKHLVPSGLNSASTRIFKYRSRIVKLLVVVAAIFAVSWFPFFVILIYAKATGNDASENAAGFSNLLLLALAAFSTAYNVILYVIFNPSFKQAILGVLRCRSMREVNDRVSVEPSQSPLSQQNQGGGETGNTFTITDASSSFDNVLSKVEMSSVSWIQ